MRSLHNCIVTMLFALGFSMAQAAQAHLMVAQQGTLNIVGQKVFMVMSLPVSAFSDIDDDHDGKISMVEFNNHRGAIVESVRRNILMTDSQDTAELQEIILSPVAPHDFTEDAISQLVVMGRFILNDPVSALLYIGLYGILPTEQHLEVSATYLHANKKTSFELTSAQPAAVLFPDDV